MVTKKTKLAKSEVVVNNIKDTTMLGYTFATNVDRMTVPTDPKKLMSTCRFFYKHDPVAGTVINKIVDCAISEMRNRKANCDDIEFATYDSLKDMLQEFYRNVCLEFLLSGLVIPHYEWDKRSGSEINENLSKSRRINVPTNIWFRDPATIRIEKSPIPNKKYFYVEVDADLISFIKSGGKRKDGSFDRETYEALKKNYPEFVAKVIALGKNAKKMEILLEDIRPIMSRCFPESAWPIPYMHNALESLMHKRNMRKMDYSIAARVISSIQLIKLGSDEFPCTDESDFEDIKNQMNFKNLYGNNERVFQLFANHTLEIEWVFPNTEAMLNNDKYKSIDDDIISAFGFPRTLITGETIRSNVTGGSDLATFSPIASMQAIRDRLVEWTKVLYKEIRDKNNFKHVAIPRFEPMKLYKLMDIATIGKGMYEEGTLSRSTRLEQQGYDLETELENKKLEKEKYKEYGIDEAPPMPFSSPDIGGGNSNPKPKAKPNTESKK